MKTNRSTILKLGDPYERRMYGRIRYAASVKRTAKLKKLSMSIISFLSLKAVRAWIGRTFKPYADLATPTRPPLSDEVVLTIRGRVQIEEDEEGNITWSFLQPEVSNYLDMGEDIMECDDEVIGTLLLGAPVSMTAKVLVDRIREMEKHTQSRIFEAVMRMMGEEYCK